MNTEKTYGVLLGLFLAAAPGWADPLVDLARDFWAWRAGHQPQTRDDIPRIERPAAWMPDWSPESVREQRTALAGFEERWKRIDTSGWTMARRVDYRLMGSALARVRWELDVNRGWRRNPLFYIDQALGGFYETLLPPPPFGPERSRDIIRRLASVPKTLEDAKRNLDQASRPFTELAISELAAAGPHLRDSVRELKPLLAADSAAQLDAVTEKAIAALEGYRAWLEKRRASLAAAVAVGREGYQFFLDKVALLPFTPEQLLAMGKQEWERAVAFETLEIQRNQELPPLAIFANSAAQIKHQAGGEQAYREFCQRKVILTFPAWLKHYRNLPLPAYLAPLSGLGVTDDLTSPARLKEDATSYIRPPSPKLGYFALATARDPRVMIAHEGNHYYQLALSWAHEDPIRRHYYDSGSNEGLAFYAEEMLLQAGWFDDSPRSREIIYNFMRLRALRVEVDVKLALGQFTIPQAARYLETTVPMDAHTAAEEAAMFASMPGQAISYQIGKIQILGFMAEARRAKGSAFRVRDFHDYLWKNGNVPIALQREEYLGQ